MKGMEVIIPAVLLSFFGVYVGILPIWVALLPMFAFLVFVGGQIFQGFSPDADSANATTGITFEKTMTNWAQSLYERQVPTRGNWNCRNCGGPNINQVKCEYCGLVKE